MSTPMQTPVQVSPADGVPTMEDVQLVRWTADQLMGSGSRAVADALRRVAGIAERALTMPHRTSGLTSKQRQVFNFIKHFIAVRGYSPSFEEIAQHFGYASLATVHEHLDNLEDKGYVRRDYNKSRSLEILPARGAL